MPNISMNKDAHKFAPVMLDVPGDCVAGKRGGATRKGHWRSRVPLSFGMDRQRHFHALDEELETICLV